MNPPNASKDTRDFQKTEEPPANASLKSRHGPRRLLLWCVVLLGVAGLELFALVLGMALFQERRYILMAFTGAGAIALLVVVVRRLVFEGYFSRVLFGLACLATLTAVFYTVENWRGKRAWEQYRSELEAQGEQFDWQAGIPPRVPDEQNFIHTPLLQAIGYRNKVDQSVASRLHHNIHPHPSSFAKGLDGTFTDFEGFQDELRGERYARLGLAEDLPPRPENPAADVLFVFKKIEPELEELRHASRRPYAQFAVEGNPLEVDVPNFVTCRSLLQIFSLRACAELALGRPDEAFKDLHVIHRLSDALESSPMLVSAMIRVAIVRLGLEGFWEGLAGGQWSDAQLEQFQTYYSSVDLLKGLDTAWRLGERNAINDIAETLLRDNFPGAGNGGRDPFQAAWQRLGYSLFPAGWVYQNQLVYTRLAQASVSAWNVQEQKVFPHKADELGSQMEVTMTRRGPFHLLAAMALPNFRKALATTAWSQTQVNQAMLACALERYRRANGAFPETLEALAPDFIGRIPHDLIGGQPLKYRRASEGKYLLYSIGWNGEDDGGTVSGSHSNQSTHEADWVWPFPQGN